MDRIRCAVERITYQNSENGYTVLKVAVKSEPDLVTAVGIMPDTHVGAVLSLEGFWKTDAKYGKQFSVERFEETLPATVYGIEKYLGSGLVKGVGPKFAGRIVQKFGKDTLDIIEQSPERLLEVPGIGKLRVERIQKSWTEQKEIKNIMLFLQSHEVSTAHATRIFKTYGSDSVKVVTENPYRLADDVWGIGFRTADTIAEKLEIGKDRFIRLRSGILYTLNRLSENGHCFAVRGQLIETAEKLLEVEQEKLQMTLDEMLRTDDLICDGEAIYLPPFFHSEQGCAKRLCSLAHAGRRLNIQTEAVLQSLERETAVRYDAVQLQAVRTAVSSKVMVLTGGPGTGKTTTTLGIISAYRKAGAEIVLAAPTGRAAKRMSEATGMEAKTIHRLLEYKPPEGYQKNEEKPLDGDVLILDECSMIDIMLMYNLLKALPDHMTLILVGDIDQLPSVGAGNVLRDIISSGVVPVVRLTQIFRQAQGSRIILNAHRINKGEAIDLRGGKDSDFFFAGKETNEEIAELLVQYCTSNLPRYYHADPFDDIQVLTPMQRGICGAANLNLVLQQALNPTDIFLKRGTVQYRLHDKVMQIRNDYEKEVFNGDIGRITAVDMEERELTVNFDGREVHYDISELDELVLAYAATIHKSQGSEYPIVVMPVTMSHFVMLQRNLLYTGVTRAKKILVLIGEKKALWYTIRNETTTARNTRLAERLQAEERNAGLPGQQNSEPRDAGGQNAGNSEFGCTGQAAAGERPKKREKQKVITYKGGMQIPLVREEPERYGGDLFSRLAQSKFRSSFTLRSNDRAYVKEKGMEVIRSHAADFVRQRLSPAEPKNDGKQTPMRGHPVFPAQHGTATCCRGCLEKWHGIPKGRALTEQEQKYIVDVIMEWIEREMQK